MRREWLARERDYLVRHYGRRAPEPLPTREIARVLGRTEKQVYGGADTFGLSRRIPRPADIDPRVAELHAVGWSHRRIARAVGVSHFGVMLSMRRQNLKPHGFDSAGARERFRDLLRENLLRHGFAGHGEAAKLYHRCQAAKAGWPLCRSVGQARVLGAVHGGARTAADVCRVLGVARHDTTVDLHLQRLAADGLVVREGTRRRYRYRVAPGVRPGSQKISGRASYRPACAKRRVS